MLHYGNYDPDLDGAIYDYESYEYVDTFTGVVEEDHPIESKPSIMAKDYAEWESKRNHEVLISDADRKLWAQIWSVGERIGAPKWLIQDVFWFYKKARALKTRPEFKGRGLYTSDEKCILAVYYVVAKKRGLLNLAEQIASMPCGEMGEPCYINRKRGDPKFKKYLNIALRYASVIYPASSRDPFPILNKVASEVPLPESVFRRAREILAKYEHMLGGRKIGTVVAASIGIALEEMFPDSWRQYFVLVCKSLGVSEISVRALINKIKKSEPG